MMTNKLLCSFIILIMSVVAAYTTVQHDNVLYVVGMNDAKNIACYGEDNVSILNWENSSAYMAGRNDVKSNVLADSCEQSK